MQRTPPPGAPEEKLEAALEGIVAALPEARPRRRASLLRRAGDVCVSLGEPRKALGWYGRAVDQWLEMGDAEQAALMCRLIIRVQPDAIRARCTLAWIAIGTEEHAAAAEQVRAYAEAARQGGQGALAALQLRWMFAATGLQAVRERIVLELRALGDAAGAEELAATPLPSLDRAELWARVLAATIGPPALTARTAATAS